MRALEPVGAHDQTLVKARDRGARLQRYHVPLADLAHHPRVLRLGHERFGYPVPLAPAVAILEQDLIPPSQLVQVVEYEVAPAPGPSEAVPGEVDVPLGVLDQGKEVSGTCAMPLSRAHWLVELKTGAL